MKIAFALYEKALVTGISLVAEMFTSASSLRARHLQREAPLSVNFIAPTLNSPKLTANLRLQPDLTYESTDLFDIVILPPMWGNPLSSLAKHPQIMQWLINQYNQGAQILATGTGVCWLAESGLLDGKVATTHWYYYKPFIERYPYVQLNRQASITKADGLMCCVSINAQSEMVLYLILERFGRKIANVIETHFGHEISRTEQQPFYQIGGEVTFDESIATAQDFIKRHFYQELSVPIIAEQCDIPVRTLQRKFKQQVGQSVHQYLQKTRLENAKTLLRDLSLNIQDVAYQVGYKDSNHFSEKFKQSFNLTPGEYRNMAKAKVYKNQE